MAGVRSSSKQQRNNGSTPSPQTSRKQESLFIIYERGQDDGGKTAFVDEAHARPQAFIDASYISAAVFSSAVDAEYAFSKISPPEPPAPLTLPDDGS